MKILSLIIQQKWFDEIIKGNKKQEFRELRPRSEKKYIKYQEDGTFDAIKFDAIRFYVGYNKNRDTALVEIKNISFLDFVDENNKMIVLKDLKTGEEYDKMDIVYDLGKVLEINGVSQ